MKLDCTGCAWKSAETCRWCRAEQGVEEPVDRIELIKKRCDDILRAPEVISPPVKSMRIRGSAKAVFDYVEALTYEPMETDPNWWAIRLLLWKN